MRDRVNAYVSLNLKEILQRKLHDPGIPRRGDLTECIAVQVRLRIVGMEAVGNVERLRTKLDTLAFSELKSP